MGGFGGGTRMSHGRRGGGFKYCDMSRPVGVTASGVGGEDSGTERGQQLMAVGGSGGSVEEVQGRKGI